MSVLTQNNRNMSEISGLLNKLPTANQSFADLRKSGAVYVDKTDYVYALASSKPWVLTRPRRFGKSTLLSTIAELFRHGVKPYDGHDSYLKGLLLSSAGLMKGSTKCCSLILRS